MNAAPENIERSGLGVTHGTWPAVKKDISGHLEAFSPLHVITLTPEMCIRARNDAKFREIIGHAGMVVPDGVGVVWGQRKLTGMEVEKIPGIDLATWCLEETNRIRGKVYLLGAKPDVVEKTASVLASKYPDLVIAGYHDGYFGSDEEKLIVQAISVANPHILLVAMGYPAQERFISNNIDSINCSVAIGIGGSFDVWSGYVKRAPAFFRKTGSEWLYRIFSQPRERLRRFPELVKFVFMVLNRKAIF